MEKAPFTDNPREKYSISFQNDNPDIVIYVERIGSTKIVIIVICQHFLIAGRSIESSVVIREGRYNYLWRMEKSKEQRETKSGYPKNISTFLDSELCITLVLPAIFKLFYFTGTFIILFFILQK